MRGRARLALTAGISVLIFLLLYMFLIRPRQGELNDLKLQVSNESNLTTSLQLELERLRSLQDDAPQLEAELARIRELVPRKDDVANFIFLVQDAADEAGVDFVTITPELPKPPPEGAPLAEVRVAIGTGGGFFSVQDFLRRLYELDRALRIDLISITKGADTLTEDATLELAITARIFFELPAGGGNVVPTDATAPAPAPATPAPAETQPAPAEPSPTAQAPSS